MYWDTRTKGFGVRVNPKTKAYMVQARLKQKYGSKQITATIGRSNIISAEQAEGIARQMLLKITQGEHPVDRNPEERAHTITLGELWTEYKNVKSLRKTTLTVYESAIKRCLADWLDKRIVDITKDMVLKRHVEISNRNGPRGKGEAHANQSMRILRSLYNYALVVFEDDNGNRIIPDNPVRRLSQLRLWNKEHRRQDIIPSDSLASWYQAILRIPNDTMRDYILLCLFTGLRRTEAANLKWKHINFVARTLTVPSENAKTGREHRLPLSDFVLSLLERRSKVRHLHNDFVFPAKTGEGCIIEPRKAINFVIQLTGVRFSMHTLRRTFETTAERLDVSHYALKRLLNHSTSNDVTAGYIVIDVERLRSPMQRISDYLVTQMCVDQSATAQPDAVSQS